ncbi:hypothetical protein V6x_41760 [Gimesia chilikensis]|uniref:Uncharacterized protein n=1 Tax=Gimesia chilikensis TaxID=2605989 RepID=A0A517WGR2_9PLAN|nr:hypothetical protein V6x_41760 [Gimesia chilikensis]
MSGPAGKTNKKNTPVFRLGQFTSPVKLGTDLLNQQLWCWGRDVECESVNLLLKYGFERIEKPAKSKAASIYQIEVSETARVILRGFGIYYGDDRWGGLFLQRYGFRPRYSSLSTMKKPAWRVEDLPKLSLPGPDTFKESRLLLRDLIEWVYSYERWVLDVQGVEYRRSTVNLWKNGKRKIICAEEMATTWAALGMFFCNGDEEHSADCWSQFGMLTK